MKLLKRTIVWACSEAMMPAAMQESSRRDKTACYAIAQDAQTIIFATDQMMALRPLVTSGRIISDYRLPFRSVIVQFTRPIPEREFLNGALSAGVDVRMVAVDDTIDALVLAQWMDGNGQMINNAIAYYASGSVNRVLWWNDEWRDGGRITPGLSVDRLGLEDKNTIRNMARAIMQYINCDNIVLERQEPPEKVNRKRRRRGKRELEPYYLCTIKAPSGAHGGATGRGTEHGYRYDVRGHIRRLKSGKTTWVRAHQRGINHLEYKPKIYAAGRDDPPAAPPK